MRLKELREDNDYTQEEIANILNCKQNTYQQYENEKRQIPLEALKKLAIFYKTSIDYILELTNETKPYERTSLENSNINSNKEIKYESINTSGLSKKDIEDLRKHAEYMKWKNKNGL